MNQLTAPIHFQTPAETARCEYDDGNPGTIVTGSATPRHGATHRRAGDWAQASAETYYDDGEAATILV